MGIFSGEGYALSLLQTSLYAKLAVFGRIYFVVDMATDSNRAMRPNKLGVPFPFSYIFLIPFLCLSPEMWRFIYSGIHRRTVLVNCALLRLVNPVLLHLG